MPSPFTTGYSQTGGTDQQGATPSAVVGFGQFGFGDYGWTYFGWVADGNASAIFVDGYPVWHVSGNLWSFDQAGATGAIVRPPPMIFVDGYPAVRVGLVNYMLLPA